MRSQFVYSVCGDLHAARVNLSLSFLKAFSRKDIVVVAGRVDTRINHDQVIRYEPPQDLGLHEASIVQKTQLPTILGVSNSRCCYIDNDVIAVSREVDSIFRYDRGPVLFSQDHVPIDVFSRHAVACGCKSGACDHLRSALLSKFGVTVSSGNWNHWNGGVFVFTSEAAELFHQWHDYVLDVFKDPYFKTRDQGALAAAVWKLKMQNLPTLPSKFNYIVDGLQGRRYAATRDLKVDDSYSLTGQSAGARPAFLHFINGTAGRREWKNWDDAEGLLASRTLRRPRSSSSSPPEAIGTPEARHQLSESNRVVHGMWIGTRLSNLELLTLKSFVRHGHEFHLWLYNELENELPGGVVVEDASQIIPRRAIFRKKEIDNECGVGRGSYGSPFSDLFRYKLLYEHGGYWVDMDVTCLRPFNFKTPYLFRTHRIGIVGNIMKCPRHSRVMRDTYEQVARRCNEKSEWLMPNRVLTENIRAHGLSRYVRMNLCNEDSWWNTVRELIEQDPPLPEEWHAIHWINEFWRTLDQDGGTYRGRRLLEYIPDKNRPAEGSTLDKLYREYDINGRPKTSKDILEGEAPDPQSCRSQVSKMVETLTFKPALRQPPSFDLAPPLHLNILVPSMSLGGAERSVFDTLKGLEHLQVSCKLFLLHRLKPCYPLDELKNVRVLYLDDMSSEAQARVVALEVISSPTPLVYTHMISASFLRELWRWKVLTVPVVQNSRPAWQDLPSAYSSPQVPFVVAVAESVARELRETGCRKPVMVVRHEVLPFLSEEERRSERQRIRAQYSIRDDTLLIGMVGQFKSQKAYTRAVRVLKAIREKRRAKLMIVGGWDYDWGNGRAAYTATCRLALDLEVMPDVIMAGAVSDARPFYSAFDLFLNTSVYEGFSVAILEAIQFGCPVVAADVGGNSEALNPDSELVNDPSDIDGYVLGIENVLRRGRPPSLSRTPDSDLIPRLWCLLAQYAHRSASKRGGTLFLAETLRPAEEHCNLSNLLQNWTDPKDVFVCTLGAIQSERQLAVLENSGVRVFSLPHGQDVMSAAERVCYLARHYRVRNICFWNVRPHLKLLLAKVLGQSGIRLIENAADCNFLHEMQQANGFQKRVCLTQTQYFERIALVVNHSPAKSIPGLAPAKITRIRSGVATMKPENVPSDVDTGTLDSVAGVCCRIHPEAGLEFLLEVAAEMNARKQELRIVVASEIDARNVAYSEKILSQFAASGVTNVQFVGSDIDTTEFAKKLKVFLSLSDEQLVSTRLLEAMATGIPVVARAPANGGVERCIGNVIHFSTTPSAMAAEISMLLKHEKRRKRLGLQGREMVRKYFSMDRMRERYMRILQ